MNTFRNSNLHVGRNHPRVDLVQEVCPICASVLEKHDSCAACGSLQCPHAEECRCGSAVQWGAAVGLIVLFVINGMYWTG